MSENKKKKVVTDKIKNNMKANIGRRKEAIKSMQDSPSVNRSSSLAKKIEKNENT